MDLRTVKELAKLKAQVGPLQRQSAELLNAAVDQAKKTAIAQFKSHFTAGGFTVVGEAKRYAATYEGLQFFLEITETHGTASFCEFSLVPPALLGEARVSVQMIQKRLPSADRPVMTREANPLHDVERELAEVRTMLSSSAPEFSFAVVEEENVDAPVVSVIRGDRPVFNSFGDFLVSVYPQ
jgi:hypothetical protein